MTNDKMTDNKRAYIIIADGEFDGICKTWRAARQEVRYLRGIGFTTRVIKVKWYARDERIGASVCGWH